MITESAIDRLNSGEITMDDFYIQLESELISIGVSRHEAKRRIQQYIYNHNLLIKEILCQNQEQAEA